MRTLILALSPLLMAGPALGQQTPICDLLKTAIAGNAVINGAAPKVTPANLAWPTGKTSVGGGRYSVVLFEGAPNAADVARMQHRKLPFPNPTGQGRADCGAYPGPGCCVSDSDFEKEKA